MNPAATSPPPEETRRLRIAVLNRVFARAGGGAEGYSVALVEQLAQRHEVHVFCQKLDHQWPGVFYHRVSAPVSRPGWINQLWFAWATARATRQGFDIVHSHENTWRGDVQTIHVRPVRYNLLGARRGLSRLLRGLKIALSPRLITYMGLEGARFRDRPGRSVVATSDSLAAEVRAAYPQAAQRLSVIPPGVEMPGPGPGRAEARALLGLPADGRLVLFVGNDYERKGLGTLLAALAELPADVRVAVAGKERHIPQFQQAARQRGLGERVHFLGSLKRMDSAYRAADCLAHPTREDSFAMVVLEALAQGLPVVVSGPAHCGISALLSDGEQALLLKDPRDAEQLAANLSRVFGDQALRAHLGRQGRAFALARSWDAVAHQYEALYRSCVSLRRRA